MNKSQEIVDSVHAETAARVGSVASVCVDEPVRLARAKGRIAHLRCKLMYDVEVGNFLYNPNGGIVFGGEIAKRLIPAYVDDDGRARVGRRWVDTTVGPQLDPRDHVVLWEGDSLNVKTTVGIDFTFLQTYGTSGLGANGLNYIALSNDSLTETSSSTTLSSEIAVNGLTRSQGTYAHTTATSTATIAHTFTCSTASQACQKAALFSASSSGTMNHALSFTQRTLQVGDSIAVTFTITIT